MKIQYALIMTAIIVSLTTGVGLGYKAKEQQIQQELPRLALELDSKYLETYKKILQLVAIPLKDLTGTQQDQLRDSMRFYQGKLHAFQEAQGLIKFTPPK